MENTCVLTVLPVIPKWNIYNLVPKKPIKYCSILKDKREFQNLLENISSKEIKNSCSIIDKKIDTSKDKNSLEIVFVTPLVEDLLSLNLIVSKKHALRRKNNLLIFLKNNANNLKYHIQDDSIYVKCGVNIQWHIFYKLLEFLLIKYGICNIGATFYCVLLSGCMLKQEIRFLCYNLVNSNSIAHPFLLDTHESDINKIVCLTSKKLPKRPLHYQNYFNASFVPSDSQELKYQILSDSMPNRNTVEIDSIMHKRKIPRLDCFCSEIHCKCHETKWNLHRNIFKYNVNCYMDILLKKGVTSSDELVIAQGELSFSSTFGNFSNPDFGSSLNKAVENSASSIELLSKINDLPLSESQNVEKYSQNLCGDSTRDAAPVSTNATENKLEPKPESLLKAMKLLNEDMGEKENFSFLLKEFPEKKKHSTSTTAFNMFQTASGKNVKISDTALKAAEKMFAEVMQSDDNLLNDDESVNMLSRSKFITKKNTSSACKLANSPDPVRAKHSNENIDEMLVEGFFEDISFDEKDEGLTETIQSSMCDSKCEKLSSTGKVRKSLGGRRSLKPYSVQRILKEMC